MSAAWKPCSRRIVLLIAITLVCGASVGLAFNDVQAQQPMMTSSFIAWSPDGQWIAISGRFGLRLYTSTLQLAPIQLNQPEAVHHIAWSPNSHELASADADYNISIWDIQTGQQVSRMTGHSGKVNSVTWSPDGSKLASASNDTTVLIWNTASGQAIRSLQHQDIVVSVGWSPDGTKLATFERPNTDEMHIWDPATGKLLATSYPNDTQGQISWSKDSKYFILSGSGLYDGTTAQDTYALPNCSTGTSTAASFSPDSTRLAVVYEDPDGGDLCVRGFPSWDELMLVRYPGGFVAMAFSPDNSRIVGVESDGGIQQWDITGHTVVAEIPNISPTPVTDPQPLMLTPLCSSAPDRYRAWLVANPNPYDVDFFWSIQTPDTREYTQENVPASQNGVPGTRRFETATQPGENIVDIFAPADKFQDTKTSSLEQCATATPTITRTPTSTSTPTITPTC